MSFRDQNCEIENPAKLELKIEHMMNTHAKHRRGILYFPLMNRIVTFSEEMIQVFNYSKEEGIKCVKQFKQHEGHKYVVDTIKFDDRTFIWCTPGSISMYDIVELKDESTTLMLGSNYERLLCFSKLEKISSNTILCATTCASNVSGHFFTLTLEDGGEKKPKIKKMKKCEYRDFNSNVSLKKSRLFSNCVYFACLFDSYYDEKNKVKLYNYVEDRIVKESTEHDKKIKTSTVIYHPTKNKEIYVCGGESSYYDDTSKLYFYDPSFDESFLICFNVIRFEGYGGVNASHSLFSKYLFIGTGRGRFLCYEIFPKERRNAILLFEFSSEKIKEIRSIEHIICCYKNKKKSVKIVMSCNYSELSIISGQDETPLSIVSLFEKDRVERIDWILNQGSKKHHQTTPSFFDFVLKFGIMFSNNLYCFKSLLMM